MRYVPRREMLARALAVLTLIVKKHVGTKRAKEFGFLHAAQEQ